MPTFRTEIVLCATAYIKAETDDEAYQIMNTWHFNDVEFQMNQWIEDGLIISNDPDAELALSPTMTIYVQTLDGSPLLPKAFEKEG